MRTALTFAVLALLGACATEPPAAADQTAAAGGREAKVVCGMEEPTGSRLKVKRCSTQDQIDQQGQEARKALERSQTVRQPNSPGR